MKKMVCLSWEQNLSLELLGRTAVAGCLRVLVIPGYSGTVPTKQILYTISFLALTFLSIAAPDPSPVFRLLLF